VTNQDIPFMKRALLLAEKARGRTSPNPLVGAVVVKNGQVLAEGYHKKAGGAHAEIEALKKCGHKAKGATLYVTLEPCPHYGRTPPCVETLIKSRLSRVVIGMMDPNPLVRGKGIRLLKARGVKVRVGVLQEECERQNESYVKWIVHQRPFVILKVAATLDGMVATGQGDSKWVTSVEARQHVHQMRDQVDAILIGVNTVVRDDPRLTTRMIGKKGRDPIRIIVDGTLYIDPQRKVLNLKSKAPTWLATTHEANPVKIEEIKKKKNVDILTCRDQNGRLDLKDLLIQLGQRGVASLLVEGGPAIHSSFINERLADKVMIYYAPKLLGGGALSMFNSLRVASLKHLFVLRGLKATPIGDDMLLEGYF